jgi:phage shock protein A
MIAWKKRRTLMAILDRIATVIRSNLNALINQAEDPEKMLDQILIDMRQQLQEAKREVATAIADEKRLAAQLEATNAQVREWDRRAVLAVERGEDDFEAFDRMAARVDQTEAQAAATVELSQELSGETMEQRFKVLEGSADVEQELQALKARVQRGLPGSSAR